MSKSKSENSGFEATLIELEKIVKDLESGETNLEESLEKFEKGIDLYKKCRVTLDQAEKKIKILTESLKEVDYKETI